MSESHGSSSDNEDLIQSALSTAFTPITLTPASSTPELEHTAVTPAATQLAEGREPVDPVISQEDRARWEEEAAEQERGWKAQSAVQRKGAEERRARIAAEKGLGTSGGSWENVEDEAPIRGPPNPLFDRPEYPASPSPADARDRVTGEPSGSNSHAKVVSEASVHSGASPPATTTLEQSQRWEEVDDVPSMESSFPSLSFPEQSDSTPNSPPKHGARPRASNVPAAGAGGAAAAAVGAAPPSATLSVFDSRLSARGRALALFSSVAINFLLPFVNGVMLGFGEIFARTMAAQWGWKIPGGAATAVGIGAVSVNKRP